MAYITTAEDEVLQAHLPAWEAEGYTVHIQPSPSLLPEFLADFRPDAILLGPKGKKLVEILGGPAGSQAVRRLRERLKGRDDWGLILLSVSAEATGVQTPSLPQIRDQLGRARLLMVTEPFAALLLGWAVLEAVTRLASDELTAIPQSGLSLVEFLTRKGFILEAEARPLREVAMMRNRIAHGDFSNPVPPNVLSSAFEVVDEVLGVVERRRALS